jgi:hypothetical protein
LDALVQLVMDPHSPVRLRQRAGSALHNLAQGNEANAARIGELGGPLLHLGLSALGYFRYPSATHIAAAITLFVLLLAIAWRLLL